MIKKVLIAIAAIFVIAIGALFYLAAPFVTTPKFIVKNESGSSVMVTAYWRDKSKDLGQLSPGADVTFEVNDEAAMEFKASFPNGLAVTSSPAVYFTSGSVIKAVVTESSIELSTSL